MANAEILHMLTQIVVREVKQFKRNEALPEDLTTLGIRGGRF
jgi:hypothetical protein